jgi:uncharacterized protein (DUF2147 family)
MKLLIVFAAILSAQAFADAPTVLGKWKTVDDSTHKAKSIVEIVADGDSIKGYIREILDPEPGKGPDPLCDKCDGDKKDKHIIGMEFLWGFKSEDKGEAWKGGHILDPNNGKTYKCKMHLKDGGSKLDVRGFIGISLLGRTQTWERP